MPSTNNFRIQRYKVTGRPLLSLYHFIIWWSQVSQSIYRCDEYQLQYQNCFMSNNPPCMQILSTFIHWLSSVTTSQHSFGTIWGSLSLSLYIYIYRERIHIYIYIYIFLGEGMATPSSILAWRIPWTEEPGRLQSIGSQRVRHCWSDFALHDMHIYILTKLHCKRKNMNILLKGLSEEHSDGKCTGNY